MGKEILVKKIDELFINAKKENLIEGFLVREFLDMLKPLDYQFIEDIDNRTCFVKRNKYVIYGTIKGNKYYIFFSIDISDRIVDYVIVDKETKQSIGEQIKIYLLQQFLKEFMLKIEVDHEKVDDTINEMYSIVNENFKGGGSNAY
ncbi:MAG: hypothetical protein ACTSW3_05625 [Promethearchaeota archaeon]